MTTNTTLRQSLADNCRELKPINNPAKQVRLNRNKAHRNPAYENVIEFYDLESVGRRVKELRKAAGHTTDMALRQLRCSRIVLAYIENGTRHVNVEVLQRIAGLYGVGFDWLCYGTEGDNGNTI